MKVNERARVAILVGFPALGLWLGYPFVWLYGLDSTAFLLWSVSLLLTGAAFLGSRYAAANWIAHPALKAGVYLPALLILLWGAGLARFSSHVVPDNAYRAVREGMAQEEVERLLGKPDAILPPSHNDDPAGWRHPGRLVWVYRRAGILERVEVCFGRNGEVAGAVREF